MEKSGLPVKGKRPSRKYRRKPSNLLDEYNRRQRSVMWLETHIWHAKRFHMLQQWGYKLPLHSTDKGFRACYRATAKHCLLQDVSYMNCIELQGEEKNLLQYLGELTNCECGLTFAAKSTLSGRREGSVTVFKKGCYPFQAIGRVRFLWRPETKDSTRSLWIWCHPAFYNEFLQELVGLFQFQIQETSEMVVDEVLNTEYTLNKDTNNKNLKSKEIKVKKSVEKVKLEVKNIGRIPKYSNGKEVMFLLKDVLNRFRLTGPLSQVVLTEALKFVDFSFFIKSEESRMEVDDIEARSEWLQEFYKDESHLKYLLKQNEFWTFLSHVNSAGELPPHMVLAATVMDPRLSMPTTRTKALNFGVRDHQPAVSEDLSCHSALWDTDMRDRVTFSKMAVAELNKLRSRALVPGLASAEWLGLHNVSHLPLLLVQNPGDQSGYGSGWDLILPAGWAMPVWLGLVFRGARVGGLRETERLTLETASGPVLPPDTKAGVELSELRQTQRSDTHFRLPPDKRPNYTKLGVVSPFKCPWQKLLEDWHPSSEHSGVYVIRNRTQLEFLRSSLSKTKTTVTCTFSDRDRACGLVMVGVEMGGRGTLREGSMICAMTKKDLKLSKDKSGRGPTEPLSTDENEEKRKTLREAHQAQLKRLRRKRVRAKRELEENDFYLAKIDNKKSKSSPTEELVHKQAEVMKELWVPSDVTGVKNSCSRCIMGYVTYGDFTFTQSKSTGYGYITLSSLLSNLERNQNSILVRNLTSLQYYVARLKIL